MNGESEQKPRPVFVDFSEIEKELGRPLTKDETMAVVLRIDAQACGRTTAATVEAMETHGGEVSDATKRILGLLPPQRIVIPGPPESLRDN